MTSTFLMVLLLLASEAPWCMPDVLPDIIPDAALPTPVDTNTRIVDVPIVTIEQVRMEVTGAATIDCATGLCRVGRTDATDANTCPTGCDSAPARRLRPIRSLFRGRR